MGKSTSDCKKFLTEYFRNNASFLFWYYQTPKENPVWQTAASPLVHATQTKNWKRRYKCRPGKGDYGHTEYIIRTADCSVNRWGDPEPIVRVPASNYAWERGFELEGTEGGIAFVVLEDKEGKLHLADYIGD